MAGVNLHDGSAEVAFEQWIERADRRFVGKLQ